MVDNNKINTDSRYFKCACCGKQFYIDIATSIKRYAWKYREEICCSYTCMRKLEKGEQYIVPAIATMKEVRHYQWNRDPEDIAREYGVSTRTVWRYRKVYGDKYIKKLKDKYG